MQIALKDKARIKCIYKTKYTRKIRCKAAEDKLKNKRRKSMAVLASFRKMHGMKTKTGFVKDTTTVFLSHVQASDNLVEHPFFHGIPHQCVREFDIRLVSQLRSLEKQIAALVGPNSLAEHRYGANGGVNLGASVVSGGVHAKVPGVSGSVQCARLLKDKPLLRTQLETLICHITNQAFGKCAWFRRIVHLCMRLNQQSGEKRTIPGTPFSGVWLNLHTKKEYVHCDRNIVGLIMVLSTYEATPGTAALCSMSESGHMTKFTLQPGIALAGTWGSSSHCNLNVSQDATAVRTSWTLYLDQRVFGSNYKFVVPKGFVA